MCRLYDIRDQVSYISFYSFTSSYIDSITVSPIDLMILKASGNVSLLMAYGLVSH